MKKTLIFLLLAAFVATNLHAQEGEIVYTDYGPEGMSLLFGQELFLTEWYYERYCLDLDHNDEDDFRYLGYLLWDMPAHCNWIDVEFLVDNTTPLRCAIQFVEGNTLSMGDTLSNTSINWDLGFIFPNPKDYANGSRAPRYVAVRFPKDNGYCYGWLEQDFEIVTTTIDTIPYMNGGCLEEAHIKIYRTAYCTIPNYPLRVGQTSFDWGMEENDATAFAIIHPNPTTGLVTITGKDLRQVEVFNMIGQRVATAQGKGETLQVDIAELPAGVYFVRVTDTEGRKCVSKVVKE
jgi:hypothetical protein